VAPKPNADVTKVPATEGVKGVKATRCKNGTRKNKNTGECEPVRARMHTQIASVAAPLPQSTPTPTPTPTPAVRVRRCKNGTRKNKNTGECEPKST
jgi:hypothetical protein